jgi:hypothetical protein
MMVPLLSNELDRMWKNAGDAYFETRLLSRYLPGRSEEDHEIVSVTGFRAEFRTGDLPETKQDCYQLDTNVLYYICSVSCHEKFN